MPDTKSDPPELTNIFRMQAREVSQELRFCHFARQINVLALQPAHLLRGNPAFGKRKETIGLPRGIAAGQPVPSLSP